MMRRLIVDFESYYDKDYSLTRMPTHQYIRDPRWQCLGCGFQEDDGEPFYIADLHELTAYLDAVDWSNTVAVAHNAQFDGAVLWERYGQKAPAFWLDTMLLARWAIGQGHLSPDMTTSLWALAPLVGMNKGDTRAAVDAGGQVLADYGTDDVRIEAALLGLFLSFNPPVEELAYMDMHVRMATEPCLELDEPLLQEATKVDPKEEAVGKILRKDKNFQYFLEQHGVEVPYKTTPSGKTKPAFAKTDAFMQELKEHPDPAVQQAAALRLGSMSNLVRTRAQRFLDIGSPFPVPLLYYAAHTGRSGGQESVNPQNLPGKGPLRMSIMAPPGHSLVVGDSRQVEARMIGWRAGDARLLETFRSSDPYRTFGGEYMYNCAPEELTDEQRNIAKAGVLGLGFAQSAYGFQEGARAKDGIHIPIETCRLANRAYRGGFFQIPRWWKALFRIATQQGYIRLPSGRKLFYPEMDSEIAPFTFRDPDTGEEVTKDMRQWHYTRPKIFSKKRKSERDVSKLWKGTTAENDTQAAARDVVFWQIWQFDREGRRSGRWHIVWMTHDEGVAVCRDEQAEQCAERMLYWLAQVPEWAEGLPVEGEVKIAKKYGEAK